MILQWVRQGLVIAIHFGLPCGSFSRARDIPGGPPPLRSDSQPMGRTDLKSKSDVDKVRVGNVLLRFCVQVCFLAKSRRIPWTLENPFSSRVWICPNMLRLMRSPYVQMQCTDFCAFGGPFRKRTAFLSFLVDLSRLEKHRCIGAPRGVCKFSGKQHVHVQGKEKGAWRTAVAEPYPRGLCKVVARAFSDCLAADKAESFENALRKSAVTQ